MKYAIDTIQYIKKNLFKLLPFAILPGIALAFTGNIASFITFFFNFDINVTSVWTVYSFFTMIGSRSWSIGVMSVLVLVFFESLLFGALDRHLKVGRFSFMKSFSTLNETVMIVVPVTILLIATFELTAFLNAVIIYFFQLVLPVVAIYIGILTTLLLYCGLIPLVIQFSQVIPAVLVVGYPINDACVYSTKLVYGKTKKIALTVLVVAASVCVISVLVSLLPGKWAQIVVDAVLYVFIIMFTAVYIMVSFFDLSDEPRRDLLSKPKNYLT